MQLQFNQTPLPYMRQLIREEKQQELTQEVRLASSAPDVGKVLLSWGQMILRSKAWRGNELGISGGVLAFVLYAPEDGSGPRCVQEWMPLQMKWDIPQTGVDGIMHVSAVVRGIDARFTGGEKLMLRAQLSVVVQGWIPETAQVFVPEQIPDDIQLLRQKYPLLIPTEAGEKAFSLEEPLTMAGQDAAIDQILRYSLQPEIIDRKVMAGKVVFRGTALVHVLYRSEDGELVSKVFSIPFSQYDDLAHIYEEEAEAVVNMALTSLELELGDDGTPLLKAGLLGQYMVCNRPVLETVEDAYSLRQEISPIMDTLHVPVVLDSRREMLRAQASVEQSEAARAVDTAFYPAFPRLHRGNHAVDAELTGTFQMLCREQNGGYGAVKATWENSQSIAMTEDSALQIQLFPSGDPQGNVMAGRASMQADVVQSWYAVSGKGIPMVTALEIGEEKRPDPDRPSLILRRCGDHSLWELAKTTGTTVAAILETNDLTQQPEPDRFLLIPVS